MLMFIWIAMSCGGGDQLPGKIVCGEGTEPYGEGCIPIEEEDSGNTEDDALLD